MTRRRRDDVNDRDNNVSSDVFRKLHIKVSIPSASAALHNIRKRDRSERTNPTSSSSKQNKSNSLNESQEKSRQSVGPLATIDGNKPTTAHAPSNGTGLDSKPATTTARRVYPPKIVVPHRHHQSDRTNAGLSPIEEQSESPVNSHAFSAFDILPGDATLDYEESFWSCPNDTNSDRFHTSIAELGNAGNGGNGDQGGTGGSGGGEKRNHFKALVTDKILGVRNRRMSPTYRDTSRAGGHRESIFSPSEGRDSASEVRDQREGGGVSSILFPRRLRSGDRQGHGNFGLWLGKGVHFLRNPGNLGTDSGGTSTNDIDGSVQNIRSATVVGKPDGAMRSNKSANPSPHGEAVDENVPDYSSSGAGGLSSPLTSLQIGRGHGTFQMNGNGRNGPFGGRFPIFRTEGISENGRGAGSPIEEERGTPSAMSPWARRLDWKKGAGNVLRRVRSWSNLDEETRHSVFDDDDSTDIEHEKLFKIEEEMRVLRVALFKAQNRVRQIEEERKGELRALESKVRRYWTLYSSLKVDQELLYRNAGEVLHENQKILGYVESNYDFVISTVGSGRRRCPGLSGHFISALRHLGDNSMGCVFRVVKAATRLYAFFWRAFYPGIDEALEDE